MSANPQSPATAYQQALELTRRGQAQRAESICLEILRQHPDHPDTLVLLGVISLQSGRAEHAAASLMRSVEIDPLHANAFALLGDALMDLRRPSNALEAYERALALKPQLLPARFGQGNALLDLQRPHEALAVYEQVLSAQPDHAEAHFNRGNVCFGIGEYESALLSYDSAIRCEPKYAAAHHNRGCTLVSLGRTEQALQGFDTALGIDPAFVDALCNRGCLLRDLRRPREALQSFDRALGLRADHPPALCGRGDVLLALRRFPESIASFDRALRLDPTNASAHFNRGNALLESGRREDALAAFDRTLQLKPDFGQALRASADLLLALQRPAAAAQRFQALLQAEPAADYAPGALLHAQLCSADWTVKVPAADPEHVTEAVLAGSRADSPFSFLAVADSPAAQLRCAQTFVAHRCPPMAPLWTGERYRHGRIRLAYVSADFRDHAVSRLMAGVFERHDRGHFETHAISLRPEERSALGQRVKGAFEHFIDVSGRSDKEAAELMRSLEIDIAVDLTGFTDGQRPQIFARRPAPVQVNYIGFPGTMGAPYMDYILADAFVIPPEQARHYGERVVHLPECFQANDDRRLIGDPATRLEAGLPEDAFVFCCFNATCKLNPNMFDIWMRLLDRVPKSVLWLLGDEEVGGHLRREAMIRGVDPGRIVFAARRPYAQHLARLQLADLFLDTLPFGAGATASDALWAGLPVLTCAGESLAARMAGSLLLNLGLPELVTQELGAYESRALELARDPGALRELRRTLDLNRSTAPLFDSARCCRALEDAYRRMWQRCADGDAPEAFAVSG